MGEEQGGGMNTPARTEDGGGRPSVATPSITIPKPKLPLPRTTTTTPTTTDAAPREWNTSKLGLRIGADALSAGAAGILVAPIITMIDKGIMENASGRAPLRLSLQQSAWELVAKPHLFLGSKPFALIFALYFGTYLTANTIDTASATLHPKQQLATQTSGSSKFVATSTANLALCLYKDNQFTRLFAAPGAPARSVPLPTFALFTVRDCLTIFASFNLPPILAPHLEQRMGDSVKSYVGALSIAQFVTPAAVQIFSTPLHLLGLDLYNRPHAGLGGRDGRAVKVARDWGMSALARICRIVPAFGVGGVVNTKVRRGLMERLEG
ncbi:putative membrane protein [Stemphylium lycopersici]|nr:putative membrane protein [Stemphylium lycopersici]